MIDTQEYFPDSACSAVILAGGQSRRIQGHKAFLDLNGKRLVQYVLDVVGPLFATVMINAPRPEDFGEWGRPVVPDVWPGKGALGGIYTALTQAPTDRVFCVACDMPFLNARLIQAMLAAAGESDILVPRAPDGYHPLHAIYHARCAEVIEPLLHANRLKISDLFPLVNTQVFGPEAIRAYDPDFRSFLNVNTWDDVERARRRLAGNTRNTRNTRNEA